MGNDSGEVLCREERKMVIKGEGAQRGRKSDWGPWVPAHGCGEQENEKIPPLWCSWGMRRNRGSLS